MIHFKLLGEKQCPPCSGWRLDLWKDVRSSAPRGNFGRGALPIYHLTQEVPPGCLHPQSSSAVWNSCFWAHLKVDWLSKHSTAQFLAPVWRSGLVFHTAPNTSGSSQKCPKESSLLLYEERKDPPGIHRARFSFDLGGDWMPSPHHTTRNTHCIQQ